MIRIGPSIERAIVMPKVSSGPIFSVEAPKPAVSGPTCSMTSDQPSPAQPTDVIRTLSITLNDPSSARIILSQTSSTDARERVLDNSYHVATLDNDAETIFEESAEFIERVVATGHGAPAAEPVGEASE